MVYLSIAECGLAITGLLPSAVTRSPVVAINELCHILLTIRGEASGTILSQAILEKKIIPAAAWYLREAKNSQGRPLDRVARFHLDNGAMLERIHRSANPATAGLQSSLGIMVNYRYHLDDVERNHEQYEHSGLVISSLGVTRGAKKFRNLIQQNENNKSQKCSNRHQN